MLKLDSQAARKPLKGVGLERHTTTPKGVAFHRRRFVKTNAIKNYYAFALG